MNRIESEIAPPADAAVSPRFGLRTMLTALVAVSLLAAASRWFPPLLFAVSTFGAALVALHVFGTALGHALRRSRPDERLARGRRTLVRFTPNEPGEIVDEQGGELRERRAIASRALWISTLSLGAVAGGGVGFQMIGATVFRDPEAALVGVLAFAFLGAVAAGLSYLLAASLFVAHRQSVAASEAEKPTRE